MTGLGRVTTESSGIPTFRLSILPSEADKRLNFKENCFRGMIAVTWNAIIKE